MLIIILCLIFLLWQQRLENDNNGTTETTSSQQTQTLNFNNYELSADIENGHGYCVATVRLPDGAIWKTGFGYIQMQNVEYPEQEFEFSNVYFEMDNALPAEKLVNIGEHFTFSAKTKTGTLYFEDEIAEGHYTLSMRDGFCGTRPQYYDIEDVVIWDPPIEWAQLHAEHDFDE